MVSAAGKEHPDDTEGARPGEGEQTSEARREASDADGTRRSDPVTAADGERSRQALVPTQGRDGALSAFDFDAEDDFELPAVLRPDPAPPRRTGPRLTLSQLTPSRQRRDRPAPPVLTTVPPPTSPNPFDAPGAVPRDASSNVVPLAPSPAPSPSPSPVAAPAFAAAHEPDPLQGAVAAVIGSARQAAAPSAVEASATPRDVPASAVPRDAATVPAAVVPPPAPAATQSASSMSAPFVEPAADGAAAALPLASASNPAPVPAHDDVAPAISPPATAMPAAEPATTPEPSRIAYAMPFLDTRMKRMSDAARRPPEAVAQPWSPTPAGVALDTSPMVQPLAAERADMSGSAFAAPLEEAASAPPPTGSPPPDVAAYAMAAASQTPTTALPADPFSALPAFDAESLAGASVAPPPLPATLETMPLDPVAYADELADDLPREAFGDVDAAAADLLRPLLREWLSSNMPRIVEKALRIEIAKSAAPPPRSRD